MSGFWRGRSSKQLPSLFPFLCAHPNPKRRTSDLDWPNPRRQYLVPVWREAQGHPFFTHPEKSGGQGFSEWTEGPTTVSPWLSTLHSPISLPPPLPNTQACEASLLTGLHKQDWARAILSKKKDTLSFFSPFGLSSYEIFVPHGQCKLTWRTPWNGVA